MSRNGVYRVELRAAFVNAFGLTAKRTLMSFPLYAGLRSVSRPV